MADKGNGGEAIGSLRRQLGEARENLRLIEERKAEFVLSTNIPLQLLKEERKWRKHIAGLEAQITAAKKETQRASERRKDTPVEDGDITSVSAECGTGVALGSKSGGGAMTREEAITWLHLSDLHSRRPDTGHNRTHLDNAKVVLDKLLDDIRGLISGEGLQPDFIVFTGDVAYSGHSDEYRRVDAQDRFDRAADFFDRLLDVTNLAKQRLFIIPGNHDVNWGAIEDRPQVAAGCAEWLRDRNAVTRFLAPETDRTAEFRKFESYSEFIQQYFGGILSFDAQRYFYVRHLSLCRRVAILGLNSAWMSGFFIRDGKVDDRHNLLVGERQVRDALDLTEDTAVKIGLLHHPFDWLQDFDRRDVEPLVLKHCDLILRGHQHQSSIVQLRSPDGTTMVIPAGACYDRRKYRERDDGYNGYNFARLDFSTGKGTIFWRRYDDRGGGRWAADTGLFDEAPQAKYEFDLPDDLQIQLVSQRSVIPEGQVQPKVDVLTIGTVLVPAGEVWIGSSTDDPLASANEKPQHKVALPEYRIGKYPVTNTQYYAFVSQVGYSPPEHWLNGQIPEGMEDHPVVNVSHEDAQAFCEWLSKQSGQAYRLPSEEEWEKAARGELSAQRRYPWGDEWHVGYCNCEEEGRSNTCPVDAYASVNCSPYGAVDMVGNVWEWTDSLYLPYSGSKHQILAFSRQYRVIKGGSWQHAAKESRVSSRGRYRRSEKRLYLGFRVVLCSRQES